MHKGVKLYPSKGWLNIKANCFEVLACDFNKIKQTLEPLVDQCPSDSCFRLSIERGINDLFHAELRVTSSFYKLKSECDDNSIDDLITQIRGTTLSQIAKWKQGRTLLGAA